MILAGGGSRRMGEDKAWLPVAGVPCLRRVAEAVAGPCPALVISARPNQRLPELPPGCVRVDDPQVDAGPLVGLGLGLDHLAEAGVELAYLTSCDAAALSPEHVAFMLEGLRARPERAAWVPVDAEGRRHPLAAAVRVPIIAARVRGLLASGVGRLQAAVAGPDCPGVDASDLPEPAVLWPANTPEQWRALERHVQGR